jgi:hypothetical protein
MEVGGVRILAIQVKYEGPDRCEVGPERPGIENLLSMRSP